MSRDSLYSQSRRPTCGLANTGQWRVYLAAPFPASPETVPPYYTLALSSNFSAKLLEGFFQICT